MQFTENVNNLETYNHILARTIPGWNKNVFLEKDTLIFEDYFHDETRYNIMKMERIDVGILKVRTDNFYQAEDIYNNFITTSDFCGVRWKLYNSVAPQFDLNENDTIMFEYHMRLISCDY